MLQFNEKEEEFDFYLSLAHFFDGATSFSPADHKCRLNQSHNPLDVKEGISPSPEESGEDEVCKEERP